jgi:hypothetical protein
MYDCPVMKSLSTVERNISVNIVERATSRFSDDLLSLVLQLLKGVDVFVYPKIKAPMAIDA